MTAIAKELPVGGFSFDNCQRNQFLINNGFKAPKVTKTGTTIVGIVAKDAIILGSDTRATEGDIVADKNCQKLHYLQPNIYACGAGTAADLMAVTAMLNSQLELHRLSTGKQVPVVAGLRILKQHLFRYQGYVSAAIILGGIDNTGAHLHSIAPHGSSHKSNFLTMGSGSLAAVSVLETRWKPNLSIEDGKKLVRDAIAAGILNDAASGSNVDLCVITKEGSKMFRPYEEVVTKGSREGNYDFHKGTTSVLSTRIIPLEVEETMIRHVDVEPMDIA